MLCLWYIMTLTRYLYYLYLTALLMTILRGSSWSYFILYPLIYNVTIYIGKKAAKIGFTGRRLTRTTKDHISKTFDRVTPRKYQEDQFDPSVFSTFLYFWTETANKSLENLSTILVKTETKWRYNCFIIVFVIVHVTMALLIIIITVTL